MSVITSVEINARMNNAITKNKGKGAKVELQGATTYYSWDYQ